MAALAFLSADLLFLAGQSAGGLSSIIGAAGSSDVIGFWDLMQQMVVLMTTAVMPVA